MFMGPGIVIIF